MDFSGNELEWGQDPGCSMGVYAAAFVQLSSADLKVVVRVEMRRETDPSFGNISTWLFARLHLFHFKVFVRVGEVRRILHTPDTERIRNPAPGFSIMD